MSTLRKLLAALAVAAAAVLLQPDLAHAGALGWAAAVGEISTEAVAVGTIMTAIVVIVFGVAMFMGMNGILAALMSMIAGGVFVGNSDAIAGVLFNGGAAGGGGSILDVAAISAGHAARLLL
jgi:hypothetical protein